MILSREIAASGRSTARVNGRAATASLLTRIGEVLVDIHGQSDHLSLLRPGSHLFLLDRYAGTEGDRATLASCVAQWRSVRHQIDEIHRGQRDRDHRIDLLTFQVADIEEAALQPGEEEQLIAERTVLANAERLTADAARAYALLSGADDDAPAIIPSLHGVSQLLADIATLDDTIAGAAGRAREASFLLDDLSAEIRDYRDALEVNPLRLTEVEERLDLIRRLKRKYGATVDEVLAFAAGARTELQTLTGEETNPEHLATREKALRDEIGSRATGLSKRRREAAVRLAAAVERAIAELSMGRSRFEVAISQLPDDRGIVIDGSPHPVAFDETGADKIEFLLAPNAGEALKPLARVASGGETARLMLALKSILAEADETPTLVFDEVDVGVGGRSGQVVGEKLWSLTGGHQVIVITHLAQIAAFAGTHFKIEKRERGGRIVSAVREIEGDERLDEIAAMLDGLPPSEESRANARQLLGRVAEWTAAHVRG